MNNIYKVYKRENNKLTFIDTHLHDDFEINFMLTENVDIISEGQTFVSSQGTICFFSPYTFHKIDAKGKPYVRYVLFFNENHITNVCRALVPIISLLKKSNSYIVSLNENDTSTLLELFQAAIEINSYNTILDDYKKINALANILYFLFPILEKQISDKSIEPGEIKEILTYINTHLHEGINVESVAKHFNMSSTTLWRQFMKHIQLPPKEYIMKKRLSKASELLAEGANVKEAAEQSGFNTYSNFISTFTRYMGSSPLRYSKNI